MKTYFQFADLLPFARWSAASFGDSILGALASSARTFLWVAALGLMFAILPVANAASLVAEYRFNGDLTSSIPGAPALVQVDPLAQNRFVSDTVNGKEQL